DYRDRSAGTAALQVRVRHRHRGRCRSTRSERGRHPADLRQEGRAGVDARLAAAGLPQLAEDARAALGERAVWADRLSSDQLLRGEIGRASCRERGKMKREDRADQKKKNK